MLRLEKTSKDEIHIRVRDREPVVKNTFLKALGIAFAFHGFALLLFHVTPFKISLCDFALPPVEVAVDLKNILDGMVTADPQGELSQTRFSIEPPPSIPAMPELLNAPLMRKLEYIRATSALSNPFTEVEKDIYQPDFAAARQSALPPVSLIITGGIAGMGLLHDGIEYWQVPKKEGRIVYSVQVQQETGQIFWFEPKEMVVDPELHLEAQKILSELKFKPRRKGVIADGEIEIHFVPQGLALR